CTNCVPGLSEGAFEDVLLRNFALANGAMLIDRGTTIDLFNTDHSGITRPKGAAWDIGAYER
ncbi:MAG: hypothetical protein KF751_19020, partial [Nitrospira sp.]|nr:hypothetical protein [Nitrospira sp.]